MQKIMEKRKSFAPYGRGIIIYTGLLWFITTLLATNSMNFIVPYFVGRFNWNQAVLLTASTVGGFIGLLGIPLFSRMTALRGPKIVTTICLAATALYCFSYLLIGSVAVFYIIVALGYIFNNGINNVTCGAIVANWYPRKKGVMLGIATMGLPLSAALGIPLLSILSSSFNLPWAMFILGVVCVLFLIFNELWLRNRPEEIDLTPDGDEMSEEQILALRESIRNFKSSLTVKKLFSDKNTWLIGISYGILLCVVAAVMGQLVPFLISIGYAPPKAVSMMSMTAIVGIIGSYVWGWIDTKISTKISSIAICLWMTMGMIVLSLTSVYSSIAVPACLIVGFSNGGFTNLAQSMIAQSYGRYDFAQANSVIGTIQALIRSLGFVFLALALTLTDTFTASEFKKVDSYMVATDITFPSAGETMLFLPEEICLFGSRKKKRTNNNTAKAIIASGKNKKYRIRLSAASTII
jgi:OFA family oxalate/formate antiporter-like MFS transporter